MNAFFSRSSLTLILAALVAAPAAAQTWTGLAAPDNKWSEPGNWDSGVPGTGATASFISDGSGNTTISLNDGTQQIGHILIDTASAAAYTIGTEPGDTLSFDASARFWINPGVTTPQIVNAKLVSNGSMSIHNGVPNNAGSGAGVVGLTMGPIDMAAGGDFVIDNGLTPSGPAIMATTRLNGNISDNPLASPGVLKLLTSASPGINNNTNFYISGNNTHRGGTIVQVNTGTNGGIYIGTDTAFGTGKLTNIQQNNVPEYRAENGTRTISNDVDLQGGINFNGTNSFVFTGDFAIVSSTSRTLRNKVTGGATVTLGANGGSSTFYLGNPLANGGDDTGRTLLLAPEAGSSMTVNAALVDPADPNVVGSTARGSLQFGGSTGGGIVLMSGLSTFTGPTLIGGGANCIIQFNNDYNSGGLSGPFGLGTITTNNTGTLQPIGGDRTLANPIVISDNAANSHLQVSNATGDTSGLTLTGALTMETAGRNITNNFSASGGILTLGSSSTPSTITLATAASQTLTIGGTGRTTIHHTIQDSPGIATNMAVSNSATTTIDGPQYTNGNLTVSGNATVVMNGNRTGTGTVTLTGTAPKLFINGVKSGGGAVTVGTTSTLSGTGSTDGDVTNNGRIAPGDQTLAPGTLTLAGNVTNGANSSWLIGLAGTDTGKLAIGGNVDLSAVDTLDVAGIGIGSSWVIATYAGTLTGEFDTITPGYDVDYGTGLNSQITLFVDEGVPGDWNEDDVVDMLDYVVWRADPANNGNDPGGYDEWAENYGNPPGTGNSAAETAAVPEPASVLLLLIGLTALAARRRRIA